MVSLIAHWCLEQKDLLSVNIIEMLLLSLAKANISLQHFITSARMGILSVR